MKKLSGAILFSVSALCFTPHINAKNMLAYPQASSQEQVAASIKDPADVAIYLKTFSGSQDEKSKVLTGFILYYGVQKGFISPSDKMVKRGAIEDLVMEPAMKNNKEAQRLLALNFSNLDKNPEKSFIWSYLSSLHPDEQEERKEKNFKLFETAASKLSERERKQYTIKAEKLENQIRPNPHREDNLSTVAVNSKVNRSLELLKNTRIRAEAGKPPLINVYYGHLITLNAKEKNLRWNDSRMTYDSMNKLLGEDAKNGIFVATAAMANVAIHEKKMQESYLWSKLFLLISDDLPQLKTTIFVKNNTPLFEKTVSEIEQKIAPAQKAETLKEIQAYFENSKKNNKNNLILANNI